MLTLLFVDLFDNLGTLVGVSKRAGLLDASGNLPAPRPRADRRRRRGDVRRGLGTSTTTSYIESAAGVEEGGRTGLTIGDRLACCFCWRCSLLR